MTISDHAARISGVVHRLGARRQAACAIGKPIVPDFLLLSPIHPIGGSP
jgi:hypothetical protein